VNTKVVKEMQARRMPEQETILTRPGIELAFQ
jgi:hypothetical protein